METNIDKLEGDLSFDGGRGKARDVGRIGDWMQTYSGKRLYPADPNPLDLDLASIVQSLCTKNRYNGHCLPYNVAEHSVLISKVVRPSARSILRFHDKAEVMVAKYGLVHDTPEEVVCDLIRPVKRVLGKSNDIFKLEEALWVGAFAPFFGLDPEIPQEVIELDTAICERERQVLHPRAGDWQIPFPVPHVTIQGLDWIPAANAWFQRYAELYEVDYYAVRAEWAAFVNADMDHLREHADHFDGVRA